MIGDALRGEIDRYAANARLNNPLFSKAADGTLAAEAVRHYLVNVHHLIRYTPIGLTHARARAHDLGQIELEEHYAQKLVEEVGHDVWAERDLESMAARVTVQAPQEVLPAIRALTTYLHETIGQEPMAYLSYILFAEYLIVILGPEWLALLEERCGIPQSSMTVVGNHAELDRDHVEEALERIDDLVGDPRKLPRMREVLLRSMAHFDDFCAEVTGRCQDIPSSSDVHDQASAA